MQSFPSEPSCYNFIDRIGSGAYSQIYHAFCPKNNCDLAIKIVDLEDYSVSLEFVRQEIASWSSSQHQNIVRYYGSFVFGSRVYLLMEYCSGGSVTDILRDSFPNGFKDEAMIATILRSILLALAQIHQNEQIHRGIKPNNAIIGENIVIKVADFGVAAILMGNGQRKRARYSRIRTPSYMAPEMFHGNVGHTQNADIWSLGITAIELATGAAPYSAFPMIEIAQKLLNAPPPLLPRTMNVLIEFRNFVKNCMNFDPKKRSTADELLRHPFLEKAKGLSQIVERLLKGLEPLGERYAKRHGKANIEAVVQTISAIGPCGSKIE
jgi:serine/threonine-protein kinase OSR1/STK39